MRAWTCRGARHHGPWVLILLCLWIRVPALQASPAPLTFLREGEVTRRLGWEELLELSPAQAVELIPPGATRPARFQAVPLRPLLEAVYGPGWTQLGEVNVVCEDGYRPALSTRNLSSGQPLLAFAYADDSPFQLPARTASGPGTPLGPYYLVWAGHAGQPDLFHEWPYQVVAVDLGSFEARYPGLALPPSSDPSATRGQAAWRDHCLVCHALGGQGGGLGPDLLATGVLAPTAPPTLLARWIEDPQGVKPGTPMPALPRDLPQRGQVIADLQAYLRAIAAARTSSP